jgi:microcystin-dependent protein
MAEPFLGEIRLMSFNFPPKGWAQCNGQLLPINQNQALFSLLGTYFGGNGQTTFALPDYRGRVPTHAGNGHVHGENGGAEVVTLTSSQLPQHVHAQPARTGKLTTRDPSGAGPAGGGAYAQSDGTEMAQPDTSGVGGGQAHPNVQPSLVIEFAIALQGIFPSQT